VLRHTDSSVAALPSAHAARLMPGVSGTSSTSSPYEAGPRALRGDSVTCVQASARVAHEAILLGRAGQRHGDLLALSIVAHRFCGFAEFAKPKGRGLGDLNVSAEARLRRPFQGGLTYTEPNAGALYSFSRGPLHYK
jgi:hypothetical protein